MLIDLDKIIFVTFLILNLAVGLFYSRGIKSVREYAVGDRSFSSASMIATITATCIGAGIFSTSLVESYRQGLYFIIPITLGNFIALFATGYFLAPRTGEFLGTQSVAAAMGKLYGRGVRIITAISGVLLSIGTVALQFKAATTLFEVMFDTSDFYSAALVAIIVTIYSSRGGVKAVTFTDILQFFTFATIIPFICLIIWKKSSSDFSESIEVLSQSPLFNLNHIFDIHNQRLKQTIALIIVFSIPGLDPAFFQRILMSKTPIQAKRNFILAGILITLITIAICYIGVLTYIDNSNVEADKLLPYILNNYAFVGFKGLIAISVMSIIMSTADSYINSATVLVTHDIFGVSDDTRNSRGLTYLRLTALSIGLLSFILCYKTTNMLSLLIKTFNFYAPVVSTSLLITIFGFRSNSKVVLTGMAAAAAVVILSEFYPHIDSAIIGVAGMLANLFAFTIAHNLYGKPRSKLHKISQGYELLNCTKQQNQNYFKLVNIIKNSNPVRIYCKSFINGEGSYQLVGFFAIICVFIQLYIIRSLSELHINPFVFISCSILVSSFVLIIFPILPFSVNKNFQEVISKTLLIPYVLICAPILMLIISKASFTQTVVLIFSNIIFISIVRWKIALITIGFVSLLTIQFCKYFFESGDTHIGESNNLLILKIYYLITFISTVLVVFFKPKQEKTELAEDKVNYLTDIVQDQNKQILNLSSLKKVFLMNLQHETNTPITGIYSMSQALSDCYDKLNDAERKRAVATIVDSSERLISYVNNLVDTSKILSNQYNLKIRPVNLSVLLEESFRKCRKLYIPYEYDEDRIIEINIEQGIIADCDEYFIRRSLENLIINAIQYCKKGKITLSLMMDKNKNEVEFVVEDSGIGIPKEELEIIFNPFTTSSKTITPAGGRGMGLTLAQAVMEMHKGVISVKSDGESGSTFVLKFPASYRYNNNN